MNAAFVGQIVKTNRLSEAAVVSIVTRSRVKRADIEKGEQILRQYGYHPEMPVLFQPVLKGMAETAGYKIFGIAVLLFIPFLAITWHSYASMYLRIRAIAKAAEEVLDGKITAPLDEAGEGDYAIMVHHFNQMANCLLLNIEALKQEKVFLKNLISDISHQLKTPISTLMLSNELLLSDHQMIEITRRGFLESSQKQLVRIEWLIKSLLKLAMLESGAIVFKKSLTKMAGPVLGAISYIQSLAEEKRIAIKVEGNLDNIWFNGDAKWTTEAILNIIKNGIEHTTAGGTLTIKVDETQLLSRISISDNGEGIAAAELPKVFNRFYRCKSTSKSDSVGIGLALSKMIVEGQNGTISVKSELGKGSQFVITFTKTF